VVRIRKLFCSLAFLFLIQTRFAFYFSGKLKQKKAACRREMDLPAASIVKKKKFYIEKNE
jgi:hypothetical protein